MTTAELGALLKGLAPAIRDFVISATKSLNDRLTAIETQDLIPGRDGAKGEKGERGGEGPMGPPGRDARIEDFKVVQSDDFRTITICYKDGTPIEGGTLHFPVVIYRGVWQAGKTYVPGDEVTQEGGQWITSAETRDKPGDGKTSWTLATKRGEPGKSIVGPEGKPGKDLTQMDAQGAKWR